MTLRVLEESSAHPAAPQCSHAAADRIRTTNASEVSARISESD